MTAHRPRAKGELEPRFRRAIAPLVPHRLPLPELAVVEEALAQVRAAHQAVHEASAILGEALQFQVVVGAKSVRTTLVSVRAATEAALALVAELGPRQNE